MQGSTVIGPFETAEKEMKDAGYDIDRIPRHVHEEHLWADGLFLLWLRNKSLPTAEELACDMFDEWDDPVSEEQAQTVLDYLRGESPA